MTNKKPSVPKSSTTKNQGKHTPTRNTNSSRSRKGSNMKWLILAGVLIALVIGYFTLGLFLTAFIAVGVGIIFGVAYLLDKTKSKKKQRRILNIVLIVFLTLAILGTVAVGGFLFYVVKSAPAFDVNLLEKKESSILYDNKGVEVTRLGSELRENVTYDDLSEVFIDALIATEDSRFFQHNGFDAPRFLLASIKQFAGQKDAGGASTLSMQVIKNSLTSTKAEGFDGIVRKFTDIYLSIFKLEKNFTKEEIIEFYVNNHFLGNNSFGVEQASQIYFGKSVKDLNLSEAALLVGMFQAPSSYDPYKNPGKTYNRRYQVLSLMLKHGYITEEEAEAANAIPITSLLVGKESSSREYQGYIDMVINELIYDHGINPNVTPLLIYTNMDRDRQKGIDDVFNGKSYNWVNEKVQGGAAVVENATGKIVAIGAGRNKNTALGFNMATQNTRQIGSTAKPIFDYGPGLEYNNWSTYTQFVDEPWTYSNGVSVNNSDRKFMGQISMRTALAQSRNIPALKAFQQTDNKKILEFVKNLGITPEVENGKIYEAHSLGAFKGATPLEMASAYAAFGNGGYYIKPYSINKIINRTNGDVTTFENEKKQVMSDSTAYMITDMLLTAVNSGLSSGAKINGVNLAAKTGTTNFDEQTKKMYNLPGDAINDAWIVGYDPQYSLSMWYGYSSIRDGYNRGTQAVIQRGKLYKALGNVVFNKNNQEFKIPSSVVKVPVEVGSDPAMLPSSNTPESQITYEYFKRGTEPTETSTKNQKLDPVKNLKVSYSKAAEKITITWDKLNAPQGNTSYGEFGYNVYYGDVLLGFTTDNKYTIDANTNISGTYKVITTFKNYAANQSNPATYNFKYEEDKPDDNDTEKDTYKVALAGKETESATLNSTYTDLATPVNILKNDTVITSDVNINSILTTIVLAPDGTTATTKQGGGASFVLSQTGTYTIQYKITYANNNYTLTRKITVT